MSTVARLTILMQLCTFAIRRSHISRSAKNLDLGTVDDVQTESEAETSPCSSSSFPLCSHDEMSFVTRDITRNIYYD